jgi:hypothetical protein
MCTEKSRIESSSVFLVFTKNGEKFQKFRIDSSFVAIAWAFYPKSQEIQKNSENFWKMQKNSETAVNFRIDNSCVLKTYPIKSKKNALKLRKTHTNS